jgi:hypothetical protein
MWLSLALVLRQPLRLTRREPMPQGPMQKVLQYLLQKKPPKL